MKRAGSKRQKSGQVKIGRASGRVKCFIRVRPLNEDEIEREDEIAVEIRENKTELVLNDSRIGLNKNFEFDHIFSEETTNRQISNFVSKPLVKAAINGFNGTVMAYGQTGAGKTYTLMSPDGVAATTIERCFRKMAAAKGNVQYKVSMSYLQIYQEKLYDLLNNAAANKIDLTIREHPQKGIYVENLSEYVVRSPDEVESLLQLGKKRLIFAETKMNRTSSRSHSVCILSIERSSKHSKQTVSPTKKHFDKMLHATLVSEGVDSPSGSMNRLSVCFPEGEVSSSEDDEDEDDALSKMMAFNDDVVLKGHLYICDLAGSERIKKTKAEGERLNEAQYINYSLLELGNVIQALAENAEKGQHVVHVPFRNSTLTRLLQESLGGNCKTSLIVCCSPSEYNSSETKSSLGFGSRAMKVRNTAYVNVEMDYKKLSDDLAKLLDAREKEIEELKSSHQHHVGLLKKEAEMAAELKFGDGLNEARHAYVSLKSLLDSQASSHAETMATLQAELSKEKDSKLALQLQLDNRQHTPVERHNKTKCLLFAEVLSMQLFYTLQHHKQDFVSCVNIDSLDTGSEETREKILENVDNLTEVLASYLNLTERDFAEASDEDYHMVKDADPYITNETTTLALESLVVKIRKRLSVLKESVDGRVLKFLNTTIHNKETASLEKIPDVYKLLEKLLEARKEATDSTFLSSSKDAERCLSYVLLDKALLCCLVSLDNYQNENKLQELEMENNELVEDLEIIRSKHKSLIKDNDRLISQLERRKIDENDILATISSGDSAKAFATLMKHNADLKLEIERLRKGRGPNRYGGSGTDTDTVFLRQQITKLTRENQKLQYTMKTMEDYFVESDLHKLKTPKKTDERETKLGREKSKLQVSDITTTSTSPPSHTPYTTSVQGQGEGFEFKEQLLTNKIEAQKSLSQLKVIKEKFEHLSSVEGHTEIVKNQDIRHLLDSAIESIETVDCNTQYMINTSIQDLEVVQKSIDAATASNESLGMQCLALANDRKNLEALLADLEGSSEDNPSVPYDHTTRNDPGLEYITEIYKTTSDVEKRKTSTDKRVHDIVFSRDNEAKARSLFPEITIDKEIQTDVSCIVIDENNNSEEILKENQDLQGNDAVQRLIKECVVSKELIKHLESEIRMFKVRTTALETELKEWQHLKDENILLEEEVKELQGLKIYMESQLVEAGSELGDIVGDNEKDDFDMAGSSGGLSKWKNYDRKDHGSLLDISIDSRLSSSSLNLNTSTPNYQTSYPSMSRSMMDLSQPQMYSSFGSLRPSRSTSGSLKMLKLELEGKPSRIRDKFRSASLLLQHTGSLETQLKEARQKCFRLEGEVCKLVKEKKEICEELDKKRPILTMDMNAIELETKAAEETSFKKKGRHSFRFKRGKEEKDRLKNELSLAKEQLSKLKSQLEMPNATVHPSTRYPTLSENEKRREKELALTRERCIILAEELGESNKEKVKLEDDLQEALDNIDILSGEIKRLYSVEVERDELLRRVDVLNERLQSSTRKDRGSQAKENDTNERLQSSTRKDRGSQAKENDTNESLQSSTRKDRGSQAKENDTNELRSQIDILVREKQKLEESIADLRWEKERMSEVDNIVKRLVEVERHEKIEPSKENQNVDNNDQEMSVLRTENMHLKNDLEDLNRHVVELESELEQSCNASLTQVLSAVKDRSSKSSRSEIEEKPSTTETRSNRRSSSNTRESKPSLLKRSRSKVQTISYL